MDPEDSAWCIHLPGTGTGGILDGEIIRIKQTAN